MIGSERQELFVVKYDNAIKSKLWDGRK